MIMTNEEYSDFTKNLFAKFKAGEITAEEVCAELNKIESVIHSGPPLRNLSEETIKKIERRKRELSLINESI